MNLRFTVPIAYISISNVYLKANQARSTPKGSTIKVFDFEVDLALVFEKWTTYLVADRFF